MKFVHRPQRRHATQSESRIALFPFLAVLICTMGALVPLLMAITYVARQQAKNDAQAKVAQQAAEVETRLEDVRWRIDMLRQAKVKTEADLTDARLELGNLEDHERRLLDELKRLGGTLDELDRAAQSNRRPNDDETELRRLQAELAAAADRLADARKKTAERKPSYAIIPFEGPNQTRRRPIYIECRRDAVVLQPEGIELTAEDFDGFLGPSNPLASALRAAREYMLDRSGFDRSVGEPYPLLLVRPDGIGAYYLAREAMSSWGADFGYELIGDDWELDFPRPDPAMAQAMRGAIGSARITQARLAAAAPSHRGVKENVVYRASQTGGGFIREEAPASVVENRSTRRGDGWGSGGNGHGGNRYAGNGSGNNRSGGNGYAGNGSAGNEYGSKRPATAVAGVNGSSGSSRYGNYNSNGSPGGSGNGSNEPGHYGSGGSGSPGGSAESNSLRGAGDAASSVTDNTDNSEYQTENGQGRYASRYSGSGNADNSGSPGGDSSRYSSGGQQGEPPEGYVAGRPPREQDQNSDDKHGRAILPGEWEPSYGKSSGSYSDSPPGPPNGHSDGASPGGPPGGPQGGPPGGQPGGDQGMNQGDGQQPGGSSCSISKTITPESLAGKRGKDWGLRDAARGSTGIQRPISVGCHADRIVVASDGDRNPDAVVPLGNTVEASIDTFIDAVWQRIESWGIAGRRMYWRPVLKVQVAPGGERRFEELKALLEGSGLTVEKK